MFADILRDQLTRLLPDPGTQLEPEIILGRIMTQTYPILSLVLSLYLLKVQKQLEKVQERWEMF